jgi:hypothetical protein
MLNRMRQHSAARQSSGRLVGLALGLVIALAAGCGDEPAGGPDAGTGDTGPADGVDVVFDGAGTSDNGDDADDGSSEPAWCEGTTAHRYDPLSGAELFAFPDDFYTRDADTASGLQLEVTVDNAPWVAEAADLVRGNLDDLNVLEGFGINADLFLRFTAPLGELPEDADASLTSDALMLLDLSVQPPERVPYQARLADEGRDLIVSPLRPLRRATRHALVVTTALSDAEGNCIQPGPTLRSLLLGRATEPALARLGPRYQQLLSATGLEPASISAAVVFTTHDELSRMEAVAADIRERAYAWSEAPSCVDGAAYRQCEGTFEAYDYRDGRHVVDALPGEPWTLPVSVWLPTAGDGPFSPLIFGHGMGSNRSFGRYLASRVAGSGFAVVGIDALQHGDHPTADPDAPELGPLRYLGIDLEETRVDGLALRGNFEQTTLDRLQLIELLRAHPDIDGDGEADLDLERTGYYGISLGGILGAPLLALSEDVGAAVLTVGGARLITIALENPSLEPLKPYLARLVGSEAELERMLVVLQALIDAADPAGFAATVLEGGLSGEARVPDLLVQVAMQDEVVPPASGRALARALDVPHLGTVVEEVALIPVEPTLPTRGNVADGAATAGFFQLDRVSSGEEAVEATHNNTSLSAEGFLQTGHFLTTWAEDGLGEILDPYEELGTPPLGE